MSIRFVSHMWKGLVSDADTGPSEAEHSNGMNPQ